MNGAMSDKRFHLPVKKEFIETISETGEKNVHYYALLEYFPEEYKLIANSDTDEAEDTKVNCIADFKDFLHEKSITCFDESLLIGFLRHSKYNTDKAQSKALKFFETRSQIIEYITEIDEEKVGAILDDLIFGILPYTDKDGNVILFTRPSLNLNAYSIEDVAHCLGTFLLFLLSCPMITSTRLCFLIECKTPSFSVFYPIVKAMIKHALHTFNFPFRFKGMDIFNDNFLLRLLYNMVRPLYPSKLMERVRFHGNTYEILQKEYHPDILPSDFGGTLSALNNECYKERFLHFIDELKREKHRNSS